MPPQNTQIYIPQYPQSSTPTYVPPTTSKPRYEQSTKKNSVTTSPYTPIPHYTPQLSYGYPTTTYKPHTEIDAYGSPLAPLLTPFTPSEVPEETTKRFYFPAPTSTDTPLLRLENNDGVYFEPKLSTTPNYDYLNTTTLSPFSVSALPPRLSAPKQYFSTAAMYRIVEADLTSLGAPESLLLLQREPRIDPGAIPMTSNDIEDQVSLETMPELAVAEEFMPVLTSREATRKPELKRVKKLRKKPFVNVTLYEGVDSFDTTSFEATRSVQQKVAKKLKKKPIQSDMLLSLDIKDQTLSNNEEAQIDDTFHTFEFYHKPEEKIFGFSSNHFDAPSEKFSYQSLSNLDQTLKNIKMKLTHDKARRNYQVFVENFGDFPEITTGNPEAELTTTDMDDIFETTFES